MDPKVVAWLDTAIHHYYEIRIGEALDMSSTNPDKAEGLWCPLVEEMCGDSQDLKDEVIHAIMKDPRTTTAAKEWLQKIS